jgi:hypothetical protein
LSVSSLRAYRLERGFELQTSFILPDKKSPGVTAFAFDLDREIGNFGSAIDTSPEANSGDVTIFLSADWTKEFAVCVESNRWIEDNLFVCMIHHKFFLIFDLGESCKKCDV